MRSYGHCLVSGVQLNLWLKELQSLVPFNTTDNKTCHSHNLGSSGVKTVYCLMTSEDIPLIKSSYRADMIDMYETKHSNHRTKTFSHCTQSLKENENSHLHQNHTQPSEIPRFFGVLMSNVCSWHWIKLPHSFSAGAEAMAHFDVAMLNIEWKSIFHLRGPRTRLRAG